MLDAGWFELEEVYAYGNFWHGKKIRDGGFVSSLGVAVPDASVALFEGYNSRKNLTAYSEKLCVNHLVDFGMPSLTTPDADAAKGMVRTNKAILFGYNKQYSVCGSFFFGSDGWPYKAPDGSTWHMTAMLGENGIVTVLARPLRSDGGGNDIAVTTSEAVDISNGSYLYTASTNFSPVDGSKAALHIYRTVNSEVQPYAELRYILEIAVSGGGISNRCTGEVTPPTAEIVVTFTPATITSHFDDTQEPEKEYIGETGVTYPQSYATGASFVGGQAEIHRLKRESYRGFAAKQWPVRSGYAYVGAVSYAANGSRAILIGETANFGEAGYTELSPYAEYTWESGYYNDVGIFQQKPPITPLPTPSYWVEGGGGSSTEWFDTQQSVSFLRNGEVVSSYIDTPAPELSFYRFVISAPNVMVAEGRGNYNAAASPAYDGAGKVLIGFLTADYVHMWPNNKAKEPYFVSAISVNAETGEYDPNGAFFY